MIGYGPIGEHVVRLADAFGMHPVIVRRGRAAMKPAAVRTLAEFDDVVASVDVVVVALPLADETRRTDLAATVIASVRPDALFVNVGRGELVDQATLTDALQSCRLGGAGLDVFDRTVPADDPLWDLRTSSSRHTIPAPPTATSSGPPRSSSIPSLAFVRGEDLRKEVARKRSADMIPFVGISG